MPPSSDHFPIVELRRYTLRPGTRDTLVELFDRHLVESQEECGMRVLGQFRDLGNPDLFVWLRGFPDMEARRDALAAFYGGPVWKKHADAANATMIDFDDVLLLKPSDGEASFRDGARPGIGEPEIPGGVVMATILHFTEPVDEGFPAWFRSEAMPLLDEAGIPVLARFVTEASPNTFPSLPAREGAHVFVWFAAFPGRSEQREALRALDRQPAWSGRVRPALEAMTERSERLLLTPTARSAIRYRPDRP